MADPNVDPRHPHGVLLTVAYDGRLFSGFSRQSNARTVAGDVDGAVAQIDPRASLIRGASRTDRGVHALGQTVAFDTHQYITPRGWALALGAHLPEQIAVVGAARVAPGFDPRRHAVHKRYRYVILQSPVRNPFLEGRAWRIERRLNQQAMAAEAAALVGEHDFAAFRSARDERSDTVRRLFRADVKSAQHEPPCIEIEVEGNGFLYHMVRIIVGTLVDVGRDRLAAGTIEKALESRSRTDLGITAPPDGLYLVHVQLDDPGQAAWPARDAEIDAKRTGL